MTSAPNFRFILRSFFPQFDRRVIRVPAPIGAGQRRLASWSTEATGHQSNRNWRHCLKNIWSKYRLPALSKAIKKHRSAENQLATLDLGIRWSRTETNLWHQLTSKLRTWTSFDTQAAKIRNFAAKRLLVAGGRAVPLLSLIGFTVVSNDVLLTDKDKMKSLCRDIRVVMSSVDTIENNIELPKNKSSDAVNLNLESLHFGDVIAKGCNAIVYSAKWAENHDAKDLNTVRTRTASNDSGIESSIEVLSPNDEGFSFNTYFERESNLHKSYKNKNDFQLDILNKSFNGYNLAVKMMFNYEAESNAPAIIQAMYKEIVPSRRQLLVDDSDGYEQRKKYLPPHPNVVELHCSFADYVPHLSRAMLLYPDALPRRINSNGSGRNMTLFLLMKRYQCSLKDYLQMYDPTPRTRLLLLAQLLEGISHLVRNNVAHRDLKNDNILLDLSEGPEFPKLVITDFGCCLADEKLGLKLPYFTMETSKGGNSALMAPEVACALPGRYNMIDYSKADLWAAGTLAYEIFGQNNPFLNTKSARLDSRTYKESDLLVPEDPAINPVILNLIRGMLQRDPIKRPEVSVAADICILMLFAPSKWINQCYLSKRTVINWLVNFAAKNLIEKSSSSLPHVEHLLSTSFLRRITLDEVMTSVAFLQNVKY